jgi:hypothetical protein
MSSLTSDRLTLTNEALAHKPTKKIADVDKYEKLDDKEIFKLQLIIKMMEVITGKKIKLVEPEQFIAEIDEETSKELSEVTDKMDSAQEPGTQRAGFGIEYDYYESHYESENTTFSAQGTVKTADGKEINISIDLSMSHEFLSENQLSIRSGDAVVKDPLVINFNGNATQLTQEMFNFDLDMDGRQDQISFAGPNSGFLALDSNGDNVINDGSELFGPRTGDGFQELESFDDDGNLWIDENDLIYNRLRIWSKEADGTDRLVALGKQGIGAIYIGNLDTAFSIKNN